MNIIKIHDATRKCGECTVCCDGWLTGNVNGHDFYPGKGCHYVDKNHGCKIYEDRPENPCKTFRCVWLDADTILPDSLRPDKSKVLLQMNVIDGIRYIRTFEVGEKIDSVVLAKIIQFAYHKNINLLYEVDGIHYPIGTKQFLENIVKMMEPI